MKRNGINFEYNDSVYEITTETGNKYLVYYKDEKVYHDCINPCSMCQVVCKKYFGISDRDNKEFFCMDENVDKVVQIIKKDKNFDKYTKKRKAKIILDKMKEYNIYCVS